MCNDANDMDSRVDAWKKKLLDLGKRNRLLNYRETKRGSLHIVAPDVPTLWQRFVEDEEPIVFSYASEEFIENDDEVIEPSSKIVAGNVETNKTITEQQKTLTSLRNKARTSINEQGVNALFLAFGFLSWTESASSKQVIRSPLILVPASLQKESITSPFILRLHDDEIVVNPTLVYKMENDFGLTLPAFETGEPPLTYFNHVSEQVASLGWSIEQGICLTLLSFLKINMYNDLENHREEISGHPVVRALAGDTTGLTVDVSSLDGYDHDANTAPTDSYLIVDADASQMDAVECAKKGASFVLQGPPGTGKSQTITNIIAECLADGKKVLFVSEKMAALDVVYRRLREAELDDFTLVLHSYKANKKNVLDQLRRSLELADNEVKLADEAYRLLAQLLSDRQKLNDYSFQLHEVNEPLHKSIFDANGEIAKCCNAADVVFPIADIRSITSEDYYRMCGALSRYGSVLASLHEEVAENPWHDTSLTFVGNELRHDLASKATSCAPGLRQILALASEATDAYGLEADTLPGLRNAVFVLGIASRSPGVMASWLRNEDLDGCKELCKVQRLRRESLFELLEATEEFRQKLGYSRLWAGPSDRRSNADLRTILTSYTQNLNQSYDKNELFKKWRNNKTLEEIESDLSELRTHIIALDAKRAKSRTVFASGIELCDCTSIRQRFDVLYDGCFLTKRSRYLEDRQALENVVLPKSDILSTDDKTRVGLEKVCTAANLRAWAEASPQLMELAAVERKVIEICEPEISHIPYDEIYLRFKAECSSFAKLLNKQYRADRATVSALIKGVDGKPSDEQVLFVLATLRRRDELRAWRDSSPQWIELRSLEAELKRMFNDAVFSLDYEAILQRYRGDYDVSFAETYTRYEADCSFFEDYANSNVALDHQTLVDEILLLEDIAREQQWFDDNDTPLIELFADRYLREETNINSLATICDSFETICRYDTFCQDLLVLLSSSDDERSSLEEKFGADYIGLCSDWESLMTKIQWAQEFKSVIAANGVVVRDDFVSRTCEDMDFAACCVDLKTKIEGAIEGVASAVDWFAGLFNVDAAVASLPIARLVDKIGACSENLDALEEILDYRKAKADCEELGLGECVAALETNKIAHDCIIPVFKKRFFSLWLDSVMQDHPAVANFRHRTQEEIIDEFRGLDKQQMTIARSRVKAKLINALPSIDRFTSGNDDVHILQREMNKKRRIMPLRRLFNAIPGLITTLKPCLMMSPLSVSLFLESELYRFDTVIFDEASQVCTENAIGAIFRGKQVIIAGDSKQLPPTNFFAASTSDDEYDSEEEREDAYDVEAFESVLDEAAMLPERTLLWHYRSRHEHLIAFSNAKIYRNRLVTFPSSIDCAPDFGVEYEYVPDGFYDRGGRKGNAVEAQRVAELVFDHFRRNPNRSLGVIAFGTVQENAIDGALRKMRLQNQEFEPFFAEELEEPFFIKSLENVQGDERDTIIFSIGYAKDANGVMRMQFGPLSQSGGERRLNVAITRAKYNVKLVGSILPTDIAVERISAEAPKLLRSYIDFAIRGPKALEDELTIPDSISFDSPFEESVYDFLVSKGYSISTQVGCSGYRIDMAVKNPVLEGTYVLGIECDGATYHSARTARERDRLRQDVLENMGWKFYRIWSTDWIKSPVTEKQRLVEAIEKALSESGVYEPPTAVKKQVETSAEADNRPYEIVSERELGIDEIENPYGFDKMNEPDYDSLPHDWTGHPILEDCIEALVKYQYPIHRDTVAQKLCPLFGKERANKAVKSVIDHAVRRMQSIVQKGDFLYPSRYERVPAYGSCGRQIKSISSDELCTAMFRVCGQRVGLTRDALIEETARAYEFKRIGINIREAFEHACERLLKEELLCEVDGRILVKRQ